MPNHDLMKWEDERDERIAGARCQECGCSLCTMTPKHAEGCSYPSMVFSQMRATSESERMRGAWLSNRAAIGKSAPIDDGYEGDHLP